MIITIVWEVENPFPSQLTIYSTVSKSFLVWMLNAGYSCDGVTVSRCLCLHKYGLREEMSVVIFMYNFCFHDQYVWKSCCCSIQTCPVALSWSLSISSNIYSVWCWILIPYYFCKFKWHHEDWVLPGGLLTVISIQQPFPSFNSNPPRALS